MDASSRGCLDSIHLHGKNSEANRNHFLKLIWKQASLKSCRKSNLYHDHRETES